MELLHLAIDSATSRPVVALLRGERVLQEWVGPEDLKHHETLLTGVDDCLRADGFRLRDLGFLSVGVGPGMFTGLRIGLTTAKFLADPIGIPCVPVSSLMALAWQSGRLEDRVLWAVSDARAKRVYGLRLAPGDCAADFSAPSGEEVAMAPQEAAERMESGDFLLGEGALLYASCWPAGVELAREEAHLLKASSVGILGARRYALGLTCDPAALQPTYLKTGQGLL
jgi:tRNA threonylcarbamoyladenosine biosynthesis protein TsaB